MVRNAMRVCQLADQRTEAGAKHNAVARRKAAELAG